MDELFEMLTLRQTRKVQRMPVVLVDQAYWRSVVNFEQFAAQGMVDSEDLALFRYAENAEGIWEQLLELGLKVPEED
jgi:predicted Rossmann-fold nucleotide-binding protein